MQRRDLIVVITIFKIFSLKILLKKLYNILKNFANLKQKHIIYNEKLSFHTTQNPQKKGSEWSRTLIRERDREKIF